MRVTIQAFGETVIDRQLTRMAANVAMPIAAWEEVAAILREATERQFDTEGEYASGGWPELADSTVKFKARHGLDPHILRATDALMDSLVDKYDPQHIERLSPVSLTFGSRVSYGIYHASTQPRSRLPYRPPVALTEADKVAMIKGIQRSLLDVRAGQLVGRATSALQSVFGSLA